MVYYPFGLLVEEENFENLTLKIILLKITVRANEPN